MYISHNANYRNCIRKKKTALVECFPSITSNTKTTSKLGGGGDCESEVRQVLHYVLMMLFLGGHCSLSGIPQ